MKKKNFKKTCLTLIITSIFILNSTGAINAYSVVDKKDSKGTYTLYSYTAQDLKNKIKSLGKRVEWYQSNNYALGELIADTALGYFTTTTIGFLASYSKTQFKSSMINQVKANQNEFKKLLKIANSAKHGVRIKRYYTRHYATGLGMVKGYHGNYTVYTY